MTDEFEVNDSPAAPAAGEKLQKVLARMGLGSRREVEGWIAAGRVSVNGQRAELGCRVDNMDQISVDDRPLLATKGGVAIGRLQQLIGGGHGRHGDSSVRREWRQAGAWPAAWLPITTTAGRAHGRGRPGSCAFGRQRAPCVGWRASGHGRWPIARATIRTRPHPRACRE